MKVVVLAEPGRLVVEERDDPVDVPGQTIIRVEAVGICGSDLHGYDGHTGRRQPGTIMGHEVGGHLAIDKDTTSSSRVVTINPLLVCGVCDACRQGTDNLCPKRRIVGVTPGVPGAYANYVQVPTTNVVFLGPGVDARVAALTEPLAVGHHAVTLSLGVGVKRLLILGGGAIGLACVMAAARLGIDNVLLSEPVSSRRSIARQLGADVVNPRETPLQEAALDWSRGHGIDAVIDAVGMTDTIGTALGIVRPGGTVVVVGMNEPSVEVKFYDLVTWERQLRGSFCYTKGEFAETAEWVSTHTRELDIFIGGVIGLESVDSTFRQLANGSLSAVKILVAPDGGRSTSSKSS